MVGRPSKTLEHKELNGTFIANPERKPRGRPPKSIHAVGEPPKVLNMAEQTIWAELQQNVPAQVLTQADRHQVEIYCKLMAKERMNVITVTERGQLLRCMSSMGLTPVDRQRLAPVEPWDTNKQSPFSEFKQ